MKKLFSLLTVLLLAAAGYAQGDTPFFSENFEGSTHAFTMVNGTETNQWHVGTATANGGSKAAYVSNDGGTTNAYTTSATSIAHMYADVTFPASSSDKPCFVLNFDWMGVGESSFDNLSVYVVETSVTPTAGSTSGLSTALTTFKGQSTWQQAKFNFPQSYAGTTKRLVFTWKNDNSAGTQPPMAVDNVALTASSSCTESGTAGSLTWELNLANETLTISGSGAMPNYNGSNNQPWYSHRSSIKSVVIAEGVTTIGSYAFYQCSNLSSVTIPSSVTSIGSSAFYGCSGLTSVTVAWATPLAISSDVFSGFNTSKVQLIVPQGTAAAYAAAAEWKYFYIEGMPLLQGGTTGNLSWELNLTDSTLTISGSGAMPNYNGSNNQPWYSHRSSIKSVVIAEGVTTIGSYAFSSCSGLTSVTLPEGVTSIGNNAFYGCSSLTSVNIPESVTTIGNNAFHSCSNLTSVTLPEGVTSIDSYTFAYCSSLTSINIPESVTTIGDNAFSRCSTLTSLTVAWATPIAISSEVFYGVDANKVQLIVPQGTAAAYAAAAEWKYFYIEGMPLLQGGTTGNLSWELNLTDSTLTISGNGAMLDYLNYYSAPWYSHRSTINSVVVADGVTSIGNNVFYNCSNLTSVAIPNSVTTIGNYAFHSCSGLISITIPSSVTTIGNEAFLECSNLTSVTIPESVTSIGSSAFYDCSGLSTVTVGWTTPLSIEESLFNEESNTETIRLIVPQGTESAYATANVWKDFYIEGVSSLTTSGTCGESLTWSYDMNGTLTISGTGDMGYDDNMPWGYFQKKIHTLILPNGLTSIYNYAFSGCTGLTSVNIPESVTSISNYAFNGCNNLTSVNIPEGVTTIGNYAFNACYGLSSVTIPNSVTTIGNSAFGYCSGLTSVAVAWSSPIAIDASVFTGITTGKVQLIVPEGTEAVYAAADVWKYFYIEGMPLLIGGTTGNLNWELSEDGTLTISGIGAMRSYYATTTPWSYYNASIKSLVVAEGVTTIGDYIGDYDGLTSVTLPSSLTTIGNSAFYGCRGLTSVTIPNSVTTIGSSAFYGCNGLTSLTIPESVISIGSSAFSNCRGLTEVVALNPQPVVISSNVFSGVTCVLKVGTNAVSRYSAADGWKDFTSIAGSGYTVSAVPNNAVLGSVSGVAQQLYAEGTQLSLTATPAAGYSFASWTTRSSGQVISTDPELSIIVAKDSLLMANFERFVAVDLTTAGTLRSKLTDAATISRLTVTGSIDVRDVKFMRDSMPVLTSLDLSGADIARYDMHFYPANEMPQYSFYNSDNQSSKTSLISIALPSNLTSIGAYAFMGCSGLTSVSIPEGVTTISSFAFTDCNGLTSVSIPEGVTTIGWYAFEGCSGLTSVSIPSSVTAIDGYAFQSCSSLSSITIPEGVTTIGENAFNGCSGLTSVTIPEGVTTIGENVFSGCSGLTSISIPSSVTAIDDHAFQACSSLTSITIPKGVTTIGSGAFRLCSSLTEVVALSFQPVDISSYDFSYVNTSTCVLKVPAGSVSLYKAAVGWKDFTNMEGISHTVSFSSQEGGSVPSQTVAYGSPATEPATPTRTNYTFSGWYREAACTNEWDFATDMVTSDTTLYARWVINTYTLTFNSQGGSSIAPQTVEHGSTATEPSAPSRTGYIFGGWFKEEACTNAWDFATDLVTSDTTLYAKWLNVAIVPFTEGFEGSLVGWATVNGEQANQWHIGEAAAKDGSRAAYISADGGTTNGYNPEEASIVHLYRDVYFSPTTDLYQLSFDWRGMGEAKDGYLYDYLSVYVVDTSLDLRTDSVPRHAPLMHYNLAEDWQHDSLLLPNAYAGTVKRLLFTWENNESAGGNPAVALDNISVAPFSKPYNDTISFTWTAEGDEKMFSYNGRGSSYKVDWGDGESSTAVVSGWDSPTHTYAAPGTYTVTVSGETPDCLLTGIDAACSGLTSFSASKAPNLQAIGLWQNQVASLDVSRNPLLTYLDCEENQLSELNVSGNPQLQTLNASTNQLTSLNVSSNAKLQVLYASANQLTALEVSQNPDLHTLVFWNNQVPSIDVSHNPNLELLSCEDNRFTALNVANNPKLHTLYVSSNQLSALDVSGNPALAELRCYDNRIPLKDMYAASQRIADVEKKYLGAQTLPTATLYLNESASIDSVFDGAGTVLAVSKRGEAMPHEFSGGIITFADTGLHVVEITNPAITSNATYPAKVLASFNVLPCNTAYTLTQTVCDSVRINGERFTASGVYEQHFTNAVGCDSTLTIKLTVNKSTAYTLTQTVCDSVRINGERFTASGVYEQHLTNAAGCDSTLTIKLTVNKSTAYTLTQTVCDSVRINGERFTASGVYEQHLTNAAGCDSTLTIKLTVNKSSAYTLTQTVCDSVRINGERFTASGVYEQHFTNAAGCDSLLTIKLTVNKCAVTPPPTPKYTVTIISATNGSISVKNGAATVASGATLGSGTVLTLQATPNTGYEFTKWWDNSTVASREFKLQADANISATFTAVAVTSVSLKTATTLLVGGTETLTATVLPANALNKSVTWSSSNTSVATVSNAGLVTAVTEGTATITVKTVDGNKTASCEVTVSATAVAVMSVSLNKSKITLTKGDSEQLTASLTPSNATNQNVTWNSNNNAVATVSEAGIVMAHTAGTATITVKTVDGGKTASCEVTVNAAEVTPPPTPKYTVTITAGVNGAIAVMNGAAVVTSGASLDSGTVLTLTATPNSGYTFTKWWDNSMEAKREFKLQADVTIAVTFTEQVTPQPTTYTVTFNSQGGSSVTAQTVDKGSKVEEPAAPTKPGYTFGGWYMEPECLNAWNFNTAITSNLTLYAKWTPESTTPTAVAANELLPLKLYPTVTNGELTVENGEWGTSEGMSQIEYRTSHIEIYSLNGTLMLTQPTAGEKTTINISQLPSGTYIVRVGKYAGKVVKK